MLQEKPDKMKVVSGARVRYKGYFDLQGLYTMVHDWFKSKQYHIEETKYKDKVESPLGTEIEVDWRATRELTEYIKYEFNVGFHTWESREEEFVIEGKKVIRMRGRMQVEVSAVMHLDWQNIFGKGNFNKFLGKVFFNVKKRELEMVHADKLEYMAWQLQTDVKKFLGMKGMESAY